MKTEDFKRLQEMQKWSFNQKLEHTIGAISVFQNRIGKVAISFSGGKDSTVLIDICRRFIDKNMPAYFINTGNEYPQIVNFVKSFENVDIIVPKISLKTVIEKYGFPMISKKQAQYFRKAKHGSEKEKALRLAYKGYILSHKYRRFLKIKNLELSELCCDKLKKIPAKKWLKQNDIKGQFIGTRVSESRQRKELWIKNGSCNNYENGKSAPLSIWLDEDIDEYIKLANLQICEIYNEGFKRTGCMFCGFGCCGIKDFRFQYLRENKPKIYDFFMKIKNNGISYRQALQIIYDNQIEF